MIATASAAHAQGGGMPGMTMSANTLLLAQLDAQQVVGGSTSEATGTGAFVLSPAARTLSYSLTYQNLRGGGAKSIALYNFGRGRNGRPLATLCGGGAQPCPAGNAATISGRLERLGDQELTGPLIAEFDAERVYVEIVGDDGRADLRGQLGLNLAMVRVVNFTARLAATRGRGPKGSGTAVVSETFLPGGKVGVFFAATVADTEGAPTGIAVQRGTGAEGALRILPHTEIRAARENPRGGTLTGSYETKPGSPDVPVPVERSGVPERELRLVVSTNRFPKGELFGTLIAVR